MTTSDYNTTFTVNETPGKVFDAITNVRGWWSENIEGGTSKLNDVFTYRHTDAHQCTMKLIEVIPAKKMVWLCMDNYFNFVEDRTEWTGTKIEFEIGEMGNKTQLRFTHWGLTPEYECFDICSGTKGWGGYINSSLRSLITTGKGQPNPKEAVRA